MARQSALAAVSVLDLRREMARRERRGRSLIRKRERLATQLSALDREIGELGIGGGGGGGRKRARNEMSLVEALAKALHGKTMSVSDAAEAVQRAGYQTTSNNFRTMVNIALINSGRFKRMGRGQYTAK